MRTVCPRCKAGLAKRWVGKALYQLCVKCHGIAISRYALSGIADPGEVQVLWSQAMGDQSPSQARCPSCLKPMLAAFSHDGKRAVELDACPRCHLIWFDHGEYEGIHSKVSEKIPTLPAAEPQASPEIERTIAAQAGGGEESYGLGTVLLTLIGLPVEERVGILARFPLFTRAIFGLTVFASAWGFTHRELMLHKYAFRATGDVLAFAFTAVSSFFFHSGWWHLLSNMYFFWVFGDDVENELGHEPFVVMLAMATIAGNALYCFSPNADTIPAIGASGGISGLISYYVIRYSHRKFRMMFFFRIFSVPALVVGGLFFVMDLLGSLSQLAGRGRVSHLSHVGGALMGAAWALYVKANDTAPSPHTR